MPTLPKIEHGETFDGLVRKLSVYFVSAVEDAYHWDDLRREAYSCGLKELVNYLEDEVDHPAIICALLALKWHFDALDDDDDRGINETRGLACELVAWRIVTHLRYTDAIDALCYDLPTISRGAALGTVLQEPESPARHGDVERVSYEQTPLLENGEDPMGESFYAEEDPSSSEYVEESKFAAIFSNLNALEIAAVSDAKKFMSQKAVQRIVDGIWKGDIAFWKTMSTHTTKQAKVYRKLDSDPYCRLRVPLYLKVFEVMFFAAFLSFYYIVLVQKHSEKITGPEVMMYIWLASFTYNELGEYWDAGSIFYATDFWALWDVAIILTGIAFFVVRLIGLYNDDLATTDTAFDILSVEALFLVPRIFSLLSLHPYFGMLLPALKEMSKDFVKFLGLVAIPYIGFSTGLAFLARGTYTFAQVNWILIKVFFGSSYLGFDVAEKISPILGPPLMFVFCCMTNILLVTSLISLLSNTLTKVMEHARDEYLFVYAVFVLEASTSNRLTYFLPPLNLLPLLLRPLRLVLSAAAVRKVRIVMLKATHWPFVALIYAYESGCKYLEERQRSGSSVTDRAFKHNSPASLRRSLPRRTTLAMPKPALLDEQPQPRGAARMHVTASMREVGAAGSEPDTPRAASMTAAITELQQQIQALTALVAAQRSMSEAEESSPRAGQSARES